ncbi:MAG: GTPase ObgE [Eubacterium coprostanoligenes]|uniref:GTPase ObgE n=1 Tax=Eubacterium coprostanoligenes TaxID=290054 RepID=UPI002409AFC7|nr:GTPase ObgE [Eubacterium coprostanoligenes]MCI6360983.1 GTPase ObgE [Eubacterium coprostanoligenes]MDD6665171.1 GTPase ObgE [Eubacterium coprostanoligenes]MDY5377174.1 GTPase ObgE [Eubacterium coprostanoligenes]
MFVDIAKIKIKGGDGGAGAVAFHREKYVAAGGPDGGDGGKGGDVVFVVDDNLATLADFRYKRKYSAPNGEGGKGGRCNGKKGQDLEIKVPRGTIIREANSKAVMADMSKTERFVAAKGGKGGWGNMHFATSTRQVPRFAKPGVPGEEWEVSLELKLLADVGLVGYPSVGKSSLISVVSQAKPKIGDYHFTTLVPNLGVVSMGEGNSFVLADIPGLIEGASEGVGLGHQFLRHVERCRMLIHIVDVSGSEGRNPIDDFEKINEELKKFNPDLAERPMIVAGNKIDMAEPEQIEEFKKYVNDKGYEYYSICAPIMEGTKELMNVTWNMLKELPPIKEYEVEEIPLESLIPEDDNSFKITQEDEGYYLVEAKWFPRVLKGIDVTDYEALQYMQRVLEKSGVFDALREKGIQEGDIVSLYDIEFEYIP